MARKHPRLTGLALVLVVAAIAAPSASALPFEQVHNGVRPETGGASPSSPNAILGGAQQRQVDLLPTQVPVVHTAPNSGFDWGDAGIGAGTAFALTMIGLGGAIVVSNRRHRKERPATTA
jgi:hypothetical protein